MRVISVHVDENDYESLKSLAERSGRPVATLIREAMSAYLSREQRACGSILEVKKHRCGGELRPWQRSELFDEMIGG